MARARKQAPLKAEARLMLPVFAACGGAGRTTVCGLLASCFAELGATVVLDTSVPLASPWRRWTAEAGGAGLESLPPTQPLTPERVRAAASTLGAGGTTPPWQVLTDRRGWNGQALSLPPEPAAWMRLVQGGGWQVALADTAVPLADNLMTSHWAGTPSLLSGWLADPAAVALLCTGSSRDQVEATAVALAAMETSRLPLHRVVLVVSDLAASGVPRQVKAALTMLEHKVAAVLRLPYEDRLRAHGPLDPQLPAKFSRHVEQAAQTLIDTGERTWGQLRAPAAVPPFPEGSSPDALDPSALPAGALGHPVPGRR